MEEMDEGLVPHHSIKDHKEASLLAEMNVLGCMMLRQELSNKAINELNESQFSVSEHKVIFNIIKDMILRGDAVDLLTVGNEVETIGKDKETGGIYYLGTLIKEVVSVSNFDSYVNLVKRESAERKLKEVVVSLNEILDSPVKLNIKIDRITEKVKSIVSLRSGKDYSDIKEAFSKLVDEIDDRLVNKNTRVGVYTGFKDI